MAKDKIKVLGKITTTVESFVAALKNSYVEKKPTIPVLTSVLVTKDSVIGTNLDLATILPFDGKGKGEFLLPHKQTLDILAGEHGPLTIECTVTLKDNAKDVIRKAKLTVGTMEFELDSMDRGNFPEVPKPAEASLTVDGSALKTLIERTRISISKGIERYTLNGTLLKAASGTITMVATDGHRLSLATTEGKGKIDDTIVLKAATEWLYKNCQEEVSIGLDSSTQTFKVANGILVARKLTGQFPDYTKVMPTRNNIVARFTSTQEFINILKRVAKCADERSGCVRVSVAPASVTLSAERSERGSAKGAIQCSTTGIEANDANLNVGFNYGYIEDFLKVVNGSEFTFSFRDAQSAGLLQAPGIDYALMPMRI